MEEQGSRGCKDRSGAQAAGMSQAGYGEVAEPRAVVGFVESDEVYGGALDVVGESAGEQGPEAGGPETDEVYVGHLRAALQVGQAGEDVLYAQGGIGPVEGGEVPDVPLSVCSAEG